MLFKILLTCLVVSLGPLTAALTPQGSQTREWPCPIASDILPCVCWANEYYNLSMDCSGVKSADQLESIFQKQFPFKRFLELRIDHDPSDPNTAFDTIGAGTFADISFESVTISGTQLRSVHDETFAFSQDTLKYLNLESNKLDDFPFESIALYTELQTFVLDGNALSYLPPIQSNSLRVLSVSDNRGLFFNGDVFVEAPALEEIRMASLGLEVLQPRIFTSLNYLTKLDISSNFLQELDEYSVASGRITLQRVNLNDNHIHKIRPEAIRGLTNNASLTMRNNNVLELTQESWQHVFQQLQPSGKIDLAGNLLKCGCDMAWIMLESNDLFRPLITDTTTCSSGEVVIYLELSLFCDQCPSVPCPVTSSPQGAKTARK